MINEFSNHAVIKKQKKNAIGLGRTKLRPEEEFSCANEKLSLLDEQLKVCELTQTSWWPRPDLEEGFI